MRTALPCELRAGLWSAMATVVMCSAAWFAYPGGVGEVGRRRATHSCWLFTVWVIVAYDTILMYDCQGGNGLVLLGA